MPATDFAQLVKSLTGLEETRLATAIHTLNQYHEERAEKEAVDRRLFQAAEEILTDVVEIKDHLKALQTGTLRETRSKREMREIRVEIDRIITDLIEFRTPVREEKDDLEDSDVYLRKLEDVETSTEATVEYLRNQVDRINSEVRS
ncbi:hypothetical protein [Haloplanus salilacus]|uniref:hypothetical protein n=1 Tax=Haloplanus salilacus TaxID=2949994 RepID=UPI0030D07693